MSDIYQRRELGAITSRWDARAQSWDRNLSDPACHLNEDAGYERFLEQARSTIGKRAEFCAKNGVIDAGCGTGLVLQDVADAFAWGIGVDLSPEMLRLAEQKHIPRTRFVLGDCFRLPELCPQAGAVLSRGVLLSHYGRPQAVDLLRAMKTVLVPGGFVLVDFLNGPARSHYEHIAVDKTYFAEAEISLLAKNAGFGKTKVLGGCQRRVRLFIASKVDPRFENVRLAT